MRAHEFITEHRRMYVKTGKKMHKHHHQAMPGAHRVAGTADRHYDLGRILTIVAAEDGSGKTEYPVQPESWAGRNNTAHPFTELEAQMLAHAYNKQGIDWDDVLKPNKPQRSLEPTDTQTTSPVAKPFKAW